MKSIMLNMKQKALPLAMSGVKNKLVILLETTGEKERYGAKLEAIMTPSSNSNVNGIFMYNAQYGYQAHPNGRDGHWFYVPSFNSEHWKSEILVYVTCDHLPTDGSVVEVGTFTYYSPEGVRGVSTPLRVRAPFDPRVKMNLKQELLASWEDNLSGKRVYSHRISLDLPDKNVSHWSVSFKVGKGTLVFNKPWTAYTHDEHTGVIELTWSAAKDATHTEKREVDFQLLSTSKHYEPALENLANLEGHYVMKGSPLASDCQD